MKLTAEPPLGPCDEFYTLRFVDGPKDGVEVDVPANSGWDQVKNVGFWCRETEKVVSAYKWLCGSLERTSPDGVEPMTARTASVTFAYAPNLVLQPNESARIIEDETV